VKDVNKNGPEAIHFRAIFYHLHKNGDEDNDRDWDAEKVQEY